MKTSSCLILFSQLYDSFRGDLLLPYAPEGAEGNETIKQSQCKSQRQYFLQFKPRCSLRRCGKARHVLNISATLTTPHKYRFGL